MKREKLVITGEENGEIIVGRKNNWDGNFRSKSKTFWGRGHKQVLPSKDRTSSIIGLVKNVLLGGIKMQCWFFFS